jgi:methyl-accepting chemotaxis protein
VQAQYQGDYNALKDATNGLGEQMTAALVHIGRSAKTVGGSATGVRQAADVLGAHVETTFEQATRVSEVSADVSNKAGSLATATEQMNASIGQIARHTQEAKNVATTAVRVAEKTNQTITKLGESAEIGQVVKLITSVAEQTNLLALNATIEAARAGNRARASRWSPTR